MHAAFTKISFGAWHGKWGVGQGHMLPAAPAKEGLHPRLAGPRANSSHAQRHLELLQQKLMLSREKGILKKKQKKCQLCYF